ncbi:MAG: hypothetical protein SWY16_18590 [Cyanobacteriota bacterium]|nr:hypothetical protein [Cyanobacteriota bacterium]
MTRGRGDGEMERNGSLGGNGGNGGHGDAGTRGRGDAEKERNGGNGGIVISFKHSAPEASQAPEAPESYPNFPISPSSIPTIYRSPSLSLRIMLNLVKNISKLQY